MKIKLLFVAVLIILSCNDKKKQSAAVKVVEEEATQEIKVKKEVYPDLEIYDFEGLKPFLNKKDNKVHVVNFWATWCGPCVKELPHFEELHSKYKEKDVEVLLVSLDFPHQFETKLKPFIKERGLAPKVVVLDDANSNSWIPKINKDWSGSIPATIIYKKDKRSFYEKSFTYEELEKEISTFLN